MCEIRSKGAGITISDNYNMIQSWEEIHQRGGSIGRNVDRSKSINGYWAVSDIILQIK